MWNLDTRMAAGPGIPGTATQFFTFATYNAANPGSPLTQSRLGGLSVSPNNRRLAFTGNDAGMVYSVEYAAGDSNGGVATLTSGKELFLGTFGATQGTTWLDNDNFLLYDRTGNVQRINVGAGGLTNTTVQTLPVPSTFGNPFTSLAYEPTISPFVYASVSQFTGAAGVPPNTTFNKLFVLDPNAAFAAVGTFDYSTAMQTSRELAFDSKGNLIVSQFGSGTITASLELIADAKTLASLSNNVSSDYYTSTFTSNFSGHDVALGHPDYKTASVNVNMRNRQVVVEYYSASPLLDIKALIASGYAGGAWTGNGIFSSNAQTTPGFGVGYAEASALGLIGGSFGGETVTGPSILLSYTRYGDANLDRLVNLGDFNRLASNFGGSNKVWSDGDFNYDMLVNLTDFNLLAANFGLTAGPNGPTPQDWAALAAAIPEPASVSVLGLASLALLPRRRR